MLIFNNYSAILMVNIEEKSTGSLYIVVGLLLIIFAFNRMNRNRKN